ncbi:4-hydroxy-2-oxovalerate aldolase [subsurface metagenome]
MSKGLKKRLNKKELTIGSWIQIGSPVVAEIMAQAGFDWLVVDMEHSAISIGDAQSLIQIIDLAGCVPLVRLSSNDPVLIKRVMDAGSHGIIVPNVNSVDDAVAAVEAIRYPPDGKRGVGLWRAQGYGFDFERYKNWQKENSIVIVQIEHIDGVNDLEAILSTERVDGFIIGPYDLSASLGIPGEFEHADFKNAIEKVNRVSKEINTLMGTHVVMPDVAAVKEKIKEGYRFIAFGIDTVFLGQSCRNGLEKIHGKD